MQAKVYLAWQKKSTGAVVSFKTPRHQYTNKQFFGRLLLGGNAKSFPIFLGREQFDPFTHVGMFGLGLFHFGSRIKSVRRD